MACKQNVLDRFNRFYIPIPETGCWLWTGSGLVYGKMKVDGKWLSAHRVSYILFKESIPDNHLVLHTCGVAGCVNPNHLYAGTHSQNQKDRFHRSKRFNRNEQGQFI